MKNAITVTIEVNADINKVWDTWMSPQHIMQWNVMSDEWHCPQAENDPIPGGRFKYVMALRDGSFSFDFEGTYDQIIPYAYISYTLDDGRRSEITFEGSGPVKLTEVFEPTTDMPAEDQQQACTAVISNFKVYVEGSIDTQAS